MKIILRIFLSLPVITVLTSCDSSTYAVDPTRALYMYIFLILALLSVLYLIFRIRRNKKRERANSSVISFNRKVESILAKLDDPQEKIKALQMMIDRIEDHEEYNKNRAWKYALLVTVYQHMLPVYYKLGEEEHLLEIFGRILELSPRHAITYYNRGSIYSNRGEYGKALEDFDKAIKYDPSYANSYNNRGLIYDKLEQYSKAIDDYSHALILHDSAITHFNRGKAYASLKRYNEALADYRAYLELDPYNQADLRDEAEQSIAGIEGKA